jgi:hypothetical protein
MKSLFLLGIAMFCTSIATAQNGSYYTVTLGLNGVYNTSDKSIPFLSKDFAAKPIFLSLERHYAFNPDFSTSISLSMNQFKSSGFITPYKAVDVSTQFYFDDYMFDSETIETYVGLGGGIYVAEYKYTTINFLGGIRFWKNDHWGINTQLIAKKGIIKINPNVGSFIQFNIGIIWSN